MSFKPYVKKPLSHSPRGEEIINHVHGYMIRTISREGPNHSPVIKEVRTRDPGQCIAALRVAKQHNIKLLVYAIGNVYGEEGIEVVDEEFLCSKIGVPLSEPIQAIFEDIIKGEQ